ncbi:MAG: N-6 DNA methylase, partial [Tannerellaceae bacterium]|nr:N-6 DNA methylase [Tannerellaceae bacterium]
NNDFCTLLETPNEIIRFFKYLSDEEKGFNGDLFPITSDEYKQIPQEAYNIIIRLLKSENITERQQSLFDLYDFSIIPIEFISNVYESFIGLENQAEEGAYYTPLFLVDYILSETVVNAIQNNPEKDCKVLDPACGSGVFLVEVLRKLIEKHIENNEEIVENSEKFKADIKAIAKKNIFGVDKDESAVQVAIFSVYLTLLDYMNPPEIATFRFPILLNTNFFCFDFFNTKAPFNTVFKHIEFNFIIGNPPWKGGALGESEEIYIKERGKKEKAENKKYPLAINNGEIVEGFVLRVSDFSKPKTKCALIVRSSILYNQGYNTEYSGFRRYWLEEFLINKIVELAPVRREVFDKSNDKAIAPAAILFYQYANGEKTDDHVLEHITIKPTRFFSYFKIFTINRHDYKTVEQGLLKRNDWLFKTLVYGSYLDFNLIFRLKKNYTSIKDVISDKTNFIYGTGIHCRKESLSNPKNTEQIKDELFISPYAVESYFIDFDKKDVLERDKVDIIKDIQLYQAPMLLFRKGLDTKKLIVKGAISSKDVIFKDAITSVKVFDADINILKYILGTMLSDIYPYIAINTFASIGIEREQTQNYDKFSVPYVECDIIELVESIEKAKIELHNLKQQDTIDNIKYSKVQNVIDNAQHEINESILNALNFNEFEKALLDYALNINRPLITRTERDKFKILGKLQKPLDIHSAEIIDYAGVYLNRFKRNIDNDVRKFVVRIWHTNQVMGMFFEIVPIDTPDENGIIWENADNKKILLWLIQLSSEKITDRLFIQKDIRGFEKERFYIFKPNENRLWHKAIAYLDVEEFMDAILKAGRRGE